MIKAFSTRPLLMGSYNCMLMKLSKCPNYITTFIHKKSYTIIGIEISYYRIQLIKGKI